MQHRRDELISAIRRQFGDSPLAVVGRELESALHQSAPGDDGRVIALIEQILTLLPQSYGKRFAFDAYLIHSVVQDWSSDALALSGMVVPCYGGDDWAYARLPIPPVSDDRTHVIEAILSPGQDKLEDVSLLTYPWLCHELGHLVFSQVESTFIADFTARFDAFIDGLNSRAEDVLAQAGLTRPLDYELARRELEALITRVQSYWEPTPKQADWAHELAADAIALWTCGPAFIGTLADHIGDATLTAHPLDHDHPSHDVRRLALVAAARALGWDQHITPLASPPGQPDQPRPVPRRPPRVHVINDKLVHHVLLAAFATCRSLQLPLCTPGDLPSVSTALNPRPHPPFGVPLFLAARQYYQIHGPAAYEVWERRTVRTLADSVEL
jgi:hypothetical protein